MPEWHDGIIKSRTDAHELQFRVLLPPGYDESGRRYPVLYLLHGLFGSFRNWTELASLQPVDDLIVVMPEGADGWYCDNAEKGLWYESRIVRDLVPAIDTSFRTRATRDARSIAGNSMGGYGALKIALRFPEMFSFAASFSGAFESANWSDRSPSPAKWDEYRPSIMRVFGEVGSVARRENDIFRIVEDHEGGNVPDIHFDCGIGDPFLESNHRLSNKMRQHGIDHQFRILPGGHDWDYWTGRGRFLTDLLDRRTAD